MTYEFGDYIEIYPSYRQPRVDALIVNQTPREGWYFLSDLSSIIDGLDTLGTPLANHPYAYKQVDFVKNIPLSSYDRKDPSKAEFDYYLVGLENVNEDIYVAVPHSVVDIEEGIATINEGLKTLESRIDDAWDDFNDFIRNSIHTTDESSFAKTFAEYLGEALSTDGIPLNYSWNEGELR